MLRRFQIAALLLCTTCNVYALEDLHLTFDSIDAGIFQANQVTVDIHWPEGQPLSASITAQSLTSDYFNRLSAINISCKQTTYKNRQFHCSNGLMLFRYQEKKTAKIHLAFDYSLDKKWQLHLSDLDLDATALSGLLDKLNRQSQDYRINGGNLHGKLDISGDNNQVNSVRLDGGVEKLSIDGETTLQDVAAGIELELYDNSGTWQAKTSLSITGGSMYLVPGIEVLGDIPGFYIEVGDKPLSVNLAGKWDIRKNILYLDNFEYIHPDILKLQGDAEIIVADTIKVPAFSIRTSIEKLEKTFPVYIQPLLLQTNFSELEVAGSLSLAMAYQDNQLGQLQLDFGDIYLDDKNKRFSLSDLSGNLSIQSDKDPVQSFLRWNGMSFHRLDFGAGAVLFESVARNVNVLHWNNVNVLDGKLEINKFNMENIGTPDFALTLDANLSPISMKAFTQAMQWPLMSGTLSGTFHGIKYSHNNLQLNGDIDIRMFNGDVVLRNLFIRDIFSEYSRLSANIDINGLDLERLTDTFTFGKIQGTLNGHVNDLVLENWQPIHFDAAFITPEDDDKPHRISQKALDNLNSLGGGLSGTMSRGVTSFFHEYSYGQIGLSCRLNGGICELGGVQDAGDGFYLLTRGGLLPPWVEVKGTGRSIKWAHLIDGLKQIIHGEVKIE